MDIRIAGYRGITKAEINGFGKDFKTALICGTNAAGKSSIAQAVGAVITGSAVPSNLSLKKAEYKEIVNKASGTATVKIISEDGQRIIELPSGEVNESGNLPKVSAVAAGFVNLSGMDGKERASVLSQYLKSSPVMEDLVFALSGVGLEKATAQIWSIIEEHGWDLAYKDVKERGAKAKGAWEAATGVSYGSKIAQGWIPSGYTAEELDEATDETEGMKGQLKLLNEGRDKAVAASAVSGVQRESLKAEADTIADLEVLFEKQQKSYDAAYAKAKELRDRLVTNTIKKSTASCPACGVALVIEPEGLRLDDEKPKKTRKKPEDGATEEAEARKALDAELIAFNTTKTKLAQARIAKEQLDRIERAPKGMRPVSEIDAEIAQLSARIQAAEKYAAAKTYSIRAANNAEICKLLAPDGLRKQKLSTSLDAFNGILGMICDNAEYKKVSIGMDLSIYYGATLYAMLSESEKYRVDAVIRLALAHIDGSPIVIFDGADILDTAGRNGLFYALQNEEVNAVVCMTFSKKDKAPKFTEGEIRSFWVEAGILEAL